MANSVNAITSKREFGVASLDVPLHFDHVEDFDVNGALYFLGTRGGQRAWVNPCTIDQPVAVIVGTDKGPSAIGFGQPNDLVGRMAVGSWPNGVFLRTKNEPRSFLGVDLGGGHDETNCRLFRVRGYCLRARNATSHSPIAWEFQASVDGNSPWQVLDKRPGPLGDNAQLNRKLATAYYPVEPIMPAPSRGSRPGTLEPEPAYRCFRILQTEKNSSGSHNLVLSGLELYGEAVQGRWA